jgi:hypothetical protein
MLQEILIKPIVAIKCTTPLKGEYFDKNLNRNVKLLTSYKVVYDRELLPHETLFSTLFSPTNTEFSFKWDSSPLDNTDEEKQKAKDKEEWVQRFLQHCQIENPENKNIQGSPKFLLIDKRKKDVNEFNLNNNKVAVYNMVKNMEADELMDVAFFSLMNPAKERLSTLQIFNRLCDLNKGILMSDAAKFLTDWKMPDATYQKVIRKAILLEVITSQNGIFKINNDIIGSGIDDLVAYMKSNTKIYEFVKSEVASRDTLPYDVSESKTVGEILAKKDVNKTIKPNTLSDSRKADTKVEKAIERTTDDDELQKLKIRMRELKIPGWQSPFIKIETVRQRISDKEAELNAAKLVTA